MTFTKKFKSSEKTELSDKFPSSNRTNILQLSDEIILYIFQALSTKDIISLSKTCQRFKNISEEPKLWRIVDAVQDNYEDINAVLQNRLHRKTKYLRLESAVSPKNRAYRCSFQPHVLCHPKSSVYLPNLTHLFLIRQKFDHKIFNPRKLPRSLKVLHLTGTEIENGPEEANYLTNICNSHENLEEFNLDHCSWVKAHSLMALCKLPKLTILSLRGCRKIGNCLAYIALSTRYGFKQLKILDATNTTIGNTEFTSLASLPSLEEFYFGQYDYLVSEEHNRINDMSFFALHSNIRLKVIDMSGSYVTDVIFNVMLRWESLKHIEANFTSLSLNAIDNFRKLKPGCTISNARSVPVEPCRIEDLNPDPEIEISGENIITVTVRIGNGNN